MNKKMKAKQYTYNTMTIIYNVSHNTVLGNPPVSGVATQPSLKHSKQ